MFADFKKVNWMFCYKRETIKNAWELNWKDDGERVREVHSKSKKKHDI